MKEIIIQPNGGLCNRLRFICSFIKDLIDNNEYKNTNIYVVWITNEACNGQLIKYIKPIKNVTFIKKNPLLNIDISSSSIVKNQINKNFLIDLPFYLNHEIVKKIKKMLYILENNYISIHIRKTDLEYYMIKNRNKRILYDDFIKFIKENKGKKVYLATDNIETQNKFKQMFKRRLYVYKDIEETNNLRQTNLEHAIIDLFICGFSTNFVGTDRSSFSCFINQIRQLYNKNLKPIQKLLKFK